MTSSRILLVLLMAIQSGYAAYGQEIHWQGWLNESFPVEIHGAVDDSEFAGVLKVDGLTEFELEGQMMDGQLKALQIYEDWMIGTIELVAVQEQLWFGHWQSRDREVSYSLTCVEGEIEEQTTQYAQIREDSLEMNLNRLGRFQWRVSAYVPDRTPSWWQFVYMSGPWPEIEATAVGMAIPDLADAQRQLDQKVFLEVSWDHMVEVRRPIFEQPELDRFLRKWQEEYLAELSAEMEAIHDEELEEERAIWGYSAFGYVEVLQRSKKCWSLLIHSNDYRGREFFEGWHYFPKKRAIQKWNSSVRDQEQLLAAAKEVTGHAQKVVLFHPEGWIAIGPGEGLSKYSASMIPKKEIRQPYKFFSRLRWMH